MAILLVNSVAQAIKDQGLFCLLFPVLFLMYHYSFPDYGN